MLLTLIKDKAIDIIMGYSGNKIKNYESKREINAIT